jgi:site-specific DNA-cytosine methylase
MTNDITWAPLVPLIGGLPLGTERATGKPPEAIYSYDGFQGNDSQYVNYQTETKGRPIPYIAIEEGVKPKKVNIVVATPPCAGLSQLNTGKTKEAKGADADVNKWMYQSAIDGMDLFEADVIIGENAPALYTNKGKPVADRLLEIARERGYAMTLYKTTTSLHGVPQNRDRTFYIFWKGGKAPIMNWSKKERKNFKEYLREIPKGASQNDLIINNRVGNNESYFRFVSHKNPGKDARDVINEAGRNTAFSYIQRNGMLQECRDWFAETGDEYGVKLADHAIMKFSKGMGIWDSSTHVFSDAMNAVIGRNLADTVHPEEDRSLSIREALHMMAFPHDFELQGGLAKMNMIAQNVPVCTAASIVEDAIKFVNGELEMTDTDFVKQNNHNQRIDVGNVPSNTLEQFLA